MRSIFNLQNSTQMTKNKKIVLKKKQDENFIYEC